MLLEIIWECKDATKEARFVVGKYDDDKIKTKIYRTIFSACPFKNETNVSRRANNIIYLTINKAETVFIRTRRVFLISPNSNIISSSKQNTRLFKASRIFILIILTKAVNNICHRRINFSSVFVYLSNVSKLQK